MSSQEEVRLVKSVFGVEVILWFCVAVVKLLESNSRVGIREGQMKQCV